jgi:cell division protein FtsB
MKKMLFFIILAISILVINNLIHSIFTLWQKYDLVTLAQKELTREKQDNQKLKSQLSYAQSKEFIEQEARNKLFLVKPGEQKVLISEDLIKGASTPSAQAKKSDPNWKKWVELFF